MTRMMNVATESSEHVEPVQVEDHPEGFITVDGIHAGTGWGDGPVTLDGVAHTAVKQPDGRVLFRR
jgi:hypothetical protein